MCVANAQTDKSFLQARAVRQQTFKRIMRETLVPPNDQSTQTHFATNNAAFARFGPLHPFCSLCKLNNFFGGHTTHVSHSRRAAHSAATQKLPDVIYEIRARQVPERQTCLHTRIKSI